MRGSFSEHSKTVDKKREDLRKLEESLLKTKKDAEKQAAKVNSPPIILDPGSKEASLQKECDKLMVRTLTAAVIVVNTNDKYRTESTQMLNVSAQLPQYDPHEVHA